MPLAWDNLEAEAGEVARTTFEQADSTCKLLQDGFAALADGILEVEMKNEIPAHVQMGLFSQNLNSLKCSVDLAMRGYYTQSMSLLRGVYENWIAFQYVAQFPEKAALWMSADERPPRHSELLNALGPSFVEDKGNAREWYGVLCAFAHTGAVVVLPHLGEHKGEASAFFGAKYRPGLFQSCACSISAFMAIMLREVSKLLPGDAGWQERYLELIERLLKFIERENEDFRKGELAK